jgi:SAM-dependent methyltransferase
VARAVAGEPPHEHDAVEFAPRQVESERVSAQRADAQQLPFEDESFDLVLCLFGIMFFPDKVRANAEARRVLRPGGRSRARDLQIGLISIRFRRRPERRRNSVSGGRRARVPSPPEVSGSTRCRFHSTPASSGLSD